MNSESEINTQISSIKIDQWQSLFDLISQIEKTRSFGEYVASDEISEGIHTFPYVASADIVDEFVSIAYELNIVIAFDWPQWKEGEVMLNNPDTKYAELDLITLCKLISIIIRADRFVEGFLVGCFEEGSILTILHALKERVAMNSE